MGLGGNGRARAFFKQHGWDDKGADKIEAKVTTASRKVGCVCVLSVTNWGDRSWVPTAICAPNAGSDSDSKCREDRHASLK